MLAVAKRRAYEAIGVPEYIVFDPTGGVLSVPLLGWRLESGAYVAWRPDSDGWFHSASLGVSFQATQPFLGVRDGDGSVIQLSREVRRQARRLQEERETLARRVASHAQRIADLEAQLRRLQEEREPRG